MSNMTHVEDCLCDREPLQPEKSVPVTGFSRELRLAPDVERYRFSFALQGNVPLPAHIVFSPAAGAAEIKAADLKAFAVAGVRSACEARQRWIAFWSAGRKGRKRSLAPFGVPRRTGNAPRLASATS